MDPRSRFRVKDLKINTSVVPLNKVEREILERNETLIKDYGKYFVAVGNALMEIRAKKLYRENYPNFNMYLEQRWGWKRNYGYKLMDAATVTNLLAAGEAPLPETERAARAFIEAKIPKDDLVTVAKLARAITDEMGIRYMSSTVIKAAARVIREGLLTESISNNDGESVSLNQTAKAAITQDAYEAMKRQQEHIKTKLGNDKRVLVGVYAVAAQPMELGTAFIIRKKLKKDGLYTLIIYEDKEEEK